MDERVGFIFSMRGNVKVMETLAIRNKRAYNYLRFLSQTIIDHPSSNKTPVLNNLIDKYEIVKNECDAIVKMEEEHKEKLDHIKSKYNIPIDIDSFIEVHGKDYDKIEELLNIISNCYIPMTRSFMLHNITEMWDTNYIIQCYRNGQVDMKYMQGCFFYNMAHDQIQTVNIKNGKRVIESIVGLNDIIEYLDAYGYVFMSSNPPNRFLKHAEYLQIDDWKETSVVDDMLDYIKNNGVTDVGQLTSYYQEHHINNPSKLTLKSIMTDINSLSLDISYQSKNTNPVFSIPIDTLVKSSMKYDTGKYKNVYFYMSSTVDSSVRLPKHIRI